MNKLAPEGYHVAIFKDFAIRKDGKIEFYFEIQKYEARAKYICDKEKAKEVYRLLTGEEVDLISRELLKRAIGKKIVVYTKVKQLDLGRFVVNYNKVVDISPYDERHEKEEECQFDPNDWSMENIMGLR